MLTKTHRLLLLTPLALVLLPFLIGPALFGLWASFSGFSPGLTVGRFVGFRNYAAVLGDRQFLLAARNIAWFSGIAVFLELAIGFGLAYGLRDSLRRRSVWRVILLLPWLVSPIANGVLWHFLLNSSTGLLNYWLAWLGWPTQPSPLGQSGLAMPATIAVEIWRNSPLVSFLVLPGLLAIPVERWEQAILEDMSWIHQIVHIAWPALRPLLLAITLLLTGMALGTFDSVLIMTGGGPGSETMTPALYSYQQAFQTGNWSTGATSAWLIVLAVLGVGAGYLALVWRDMQ